MQAKVGSSPAMSHDTRQHTHTRTHLCGLDLWWYSSQLAGAARTSILHFSSILHLSLHNRCFAFQYDGGWSRVALASVCTWGEEDHDDDDDDDDVHTFISVWIRIIISKRFPAGRPTFWCKTIHNVNYKTALTWQQKPCTSTGMMVIYYVNGVNPDLTMNTSSRLFLIWASSDFIRHASYMKC